MFFERNFSSENLEKPKKNNVSSMDTLRSKDSYGALRKVKNYQFVTSSDRRFYEIFKAGTFSEYAHETELKSARCAAVFV